MISTETLKKVFEECLQGIGMSVIPDKEDWGEIKIYIAIPSTVNLDTKLLISAQKAAKSNNLKFGSNLLSTETTTTLSDIYTWIEEEIDE